MPRIPNCIEGQVLLNFKKVQGVILDFLVAEAAARLAPTVGWESSKS